MQRIHREQSARNGSEHDTAAKDDRGDTEVEVESTELTEGRDDKGNMVHLVRNENGDGGSGNTAQVNIPSPGYPTKLPKERGNQIAGENANDDSLLQLER